MTAVGAAAPRDAQAARIVLAYPRRRGKSAHEVASQDSLARKIAELLGYEFMTDDEFVRAAPDAAAYYVPGDTLVESERIAESRLSVLRSDQDLFGGVVPHAFVATKAITHTLIDSNALYPPGWSLHFGDQVQGTVLKGFTVFSIDDARRAGALLLRNGPIRVKSVNGIGGRGQRLALDHAELESAIHEHDTADLAQCGLVLEEHLEDVQTYSVGHVHVGQWTTTYVGTQSLTEDQSGMKVYGGSELRLVRGNFDALLALELSDDERRAVRLARVYDRAALKCYAGMFASRRNYDVARGADASGAIQFGVLEQSWRAGGASMAEAYALEAFQQQPTLRSVRAFTYERYGASHTPPPSAQLVYKGDDAQGGLIAKYAGISSYEDEI